MNKEADVLKAIPLGGHGEIGKNAWIIEQNDEILIVDFGSRLPGSDRSGIDLILPNTTYLKENEKKIKGLVLTSAHDEACGGVFYLLEKINIPKIWAPKLAIETIGQDLNGGVNLPEVEILEPRKEIKIGDSFTVKPINNTFCMPETYGLIIDSPSGKIVYTGSYKVDQTPPDKILLDYYSYAKAGEDEVAILIGASENIETPGYSSTEGKITNKFNEIFRDNSGRIIVVCSSCEIFKYQILFNLAHLHKKKVYLSGEQILKQVNAAIKTGHLTAEKGLLLSKKEFESNKNTDVVIITTGNHGNFLGGLVDLANEQHEIKITQDDLIVISAEPPHGTIRLLAHTTDQLYVQKVKVIGGNNLGLHFKPYATQEELKFILCCTKPRTFVPSHGEERHLVMHGRIAEAMGINRHDVHIVRNGEVIELRGKVARVAGKIPATSIYYNKAKGIDIDEVTMRERETLSAEGTVTVALTLDKDRNIIAGPEIFAEACSFAKGKDWKVFCLSTIEHIKATVKESVSTDQKEIPLIKSAVKDTLNKFIIELVGRRPLVNVAIQEVDLANSK